MAERAGFEPAVPFWGTRHFQCRTIGQLGHLSGINGYLFNISCSFCLAPIFSAGLYVMKKLVALFCNYALQCSP